MGPPSPFFFLLAVVLPAPRPWVERGALSLSLLKKNPCLLKKNHRTVSEKNTEKVRGENMWGAPCVGRARALGGVVNINII